MRGAKALLVGWGGAGKAAGGRAMGGAVSWVLGDSWRREHSALPEGGWGGRDDLHPFF